ncbi:MAG: nucleotide-binding protein [Microcoleaceae cyanobacterium]
MTHVYLKDIYADVQDPGQVLGTQSTCGMLRQGVDQERSLSIDNGALRIPFIRCPGWGKQGIAYGPYERQSGLTLAVLLLNGHNNSETGDLKQSFVRRVARWVLGTGAFSPWQQITGLLRSPYKARMLQRLRFWFNHAPQRFKGPILKDNLAIGWFPRPVPDDPAQTGHTMLVRSSMPQNGAVHVRTGQALPMALPDIQNLQIYYLIVLRPKGAAYYIASVPNAKGMAAYPEIRPIGIDPLGQEPQLYAGIHQSVLGQLGFSTDTRVYSTQVDVVSQWSNWYGTAHSANQLRGSGSLSESSSEENGIWQVMQGEYQRTTAGIIAQADNSLAVIHPEAPSGLVHVKVTTPTEVTPVEIWWRVQDQDNFWSFSISSQKSELKLKHNGNWQTLAIEETIRLAQDTLNTLQILDDGQTACLYCNGQQVCSVSDSRLQEFTALGIFSPQANSQQHFSDFEAHPRQVSLPAQYRIRNPWSLDLPKDDTAPAITENFEGPAQELTNKHSTTGGQVWHKLMGTGAICLTGEASAKVQASWQQPHPGRTAYGLDWHCPNFADLQVQITAPERHQGKKTEGRGGLIFWQDPKNFFAISNCVSRIHAGSAVSCFFCIDGYEDLHSAVWANTDDRIQWGVPVSFRVCFDGMHYQAILEGEPIIYRALTDIFPKIEPLAIRRVGIIANWEWGGGDMGSQFNHFVAR